MNDCSGHRSQLVVAAFAAVPIVDGKPKPLQFFGAQEARQCLAGKKVYFGGDSYMEQFFIGLVGGCSLTSLANDCMRGIIALAPR